MGAAPCLSPLLLLRRVLRGPRSRRAARACAARARAARRTLAARPAQAVALSDQIRIMGSRLIAAASSCPALLGEGGFARVEPDPRERGTPITYLPEKAPVSVRICRVFAGEGTVPKRRTLRERVRERIARRRDDVFLTREFRDLGGEDQVLRALRGLVCDGQLAPLGRADPRQRGRFHRRGAAGPRQARRGLGTDRRRARLQRSPLHPGAGQSGGAGEGPLRAPAPLSGHGAADRPGLKCQPVHSICANSHKQGIRVDAIYFRAECTKLVRRRETGYSRPGIHLRRAAGPKACPGTAWAAFCIPGLARVGRRLGA